MVTPTAAAAIVLSDRARAIESTSVAKSVGVSLVGAVDRVAASAPWGTVAAVVSAAVVAAAGAVVAAVSELSAVLVPLVVECDPLACDPLACDPLTCDPPTCDPAVCEALACDAVLAASDVPTALVARVLRLAVAVGRVAVRICGSATVAAMAARLALGRAAAGVVAVSGDAVGVCAAVGVWASVVAPATWGVAPGLAAVCTVVRVCAVVNAVAAGVGWIGSVGVIVAVESVAGRAVSFALADLSRAVWPVPVPVPVAVLPVAVLPVAALVVIGVAAVADSADAARIRLLTGKDLPVVAARAGIVAGVVAGAVAAGKVAVEASCCACKVDANPPVPPDEAPESPFAAGLAGIVEVTAAGFALWAEAAAAIVTVIDLVLPAKWYSWLSEKRANSGRLRAPAQVLRAGRAPSGTAAAA